ncbi:hypothetical protein [Spirosoma fluviale]|uniref:Uncharacterized protein n=1 Tax=Spirosoma fluviale TaxID=1597977 RepID=A0A286G9T4_9BACT|nr:hypothetical protein [Spirosoma fluviale]SOD91744.1 hypothetical protein SAMN06269250_3618 [Spirosoma fluviale]
MLVAVEGIYQNGQVYLHDKVPFENETKVIVTFLEDPTKKPESKRLTMNNFSFRKPRDVLKDHKGSLSDEVIKKRRESL